jgi:hypothetical protein
MVKERTLVKEGQEKPPKETELKRTGGSHIQKDIKTRNNVVS